MAGSGETLAQALKAEVRKGSRQTGAPLKLYLAGRIERSQVRFGAALCLMDGDRADDPTYLPEAMGTLCRGDDHDEKQFVYTGPFTLGCDHGCGHRSTLGTRTHGADMNEDTTGAGAPSDIVLAQAIYGRAMRGIDACDIFFAWIADEECFGTLVELAQGQGQDDLPGASTDRQAARRTVVRLAGWRAVEAATPEAAPRLLGEFLIRDDWLALPRRARAELCAQRALQSCAVIDGPRSEKTGQLPRCPAPNVITHSPTLGDSCPRSRAHWAASTGSAVQLRPVGMVDPEAAGRPRKARKGPTRRTVATRAKNAASGPPDSGPFGRCRSTPRCWRHRIGWSGSWSNGAKPKKVPFYATGKPHSGTSIRPQTSASWCPIPWPSKPRPSTTSPAWASPSTGDTSSSTSTGAAIPTRARSNPGHEDRDAAIGRLRGGVDQRHIHIVGYHPSGEIDSFPTCTKKPAERYTHGRFMAMGREVWNTGSDPLPDLTPLIGMLPVSKTTSTSLARPKLRLVTGTAPTRWIIERSKLPGYLAVLNPDMDHDDWIKVGMGIHHGSGGTDEGRVFWDGWSREGEVQGG
jgi:hypothetical protein